MITIKGDVRKEHGWRLKERFLKLKEEKNVVVLVHNYQLPEIQEVADYIGDSFGLSKKAAKTKADIILFCGVDFMAETAAILNPNKKVLIPAPEAKCPMAKMLPPEVVREYKKRYPKAAVAVYVNTLAVTKAEADIVFTSSNAVKVCQSLPHKQILVGPDRNLALYIRRQLPDKEIIPMPSDGFCYVHRRFSPEDIEAVKALGHSKVMVHPECRLDVHDRADFVGSTAQMFEHPAQTKEKRFVIGTEVGLLYRMKKTYPKKKFHPLNPQAICKQMKMNTLEKCYEALKKEKYIVKVEDIIAKKAKRALQRMMEVCK